MSSVLEAELAIVSAALFSLLFLIRQPRHA
jgi:hypothetical protein